MNINIDSIILLTLGDVVILSGMYLYSQTENFKFKLFSFLSILFGLCVSYISLFPSLIIALRYK